MNADKNTALYEKMAAEQDKLRDWLKSQPPEEILNHAYEYVVREDILMAMEELDLPQSRAAALLASPSPLADVYKEFADRETSYMDVVRDSIEQRAEAALDAQRELPLYRHDAAYAREQGDLDLYRASRRANIACKEAIEASISEHYRDNRLDKDAVPQVIEQFGYTRTLYVLANTVQQKDWDGRFSPANKAQEAARALFGGSGSSENMPATQLPEARFTDGKIGAIELLVACGLCASNGEARRLIQQGGVAVDDQKVASIDVTFDQAQFAGDGVVIKKGKKVFHRAYTA